MPLALHNSVFNDNSTHNQLVNASMMVEKPCPTFSPVIMSYFPNSPIGWNAVLVGLLSSILAILFLLTCLYHLFCRRRYYTDSETSTSVGLIEKNGSIPVTTSSQTATTTFINEQEKETTYNEQGKTSATNGDLVVGIPTLTNGHTGSSSTNGLLANGNVDPSELRLLQHEHH